MKYEKLKEKSTIVKHTPLPGYNLINMVGLLAQNKFRIGIRYIPRFFYSLILGLLLSPFRIKERILFDKKIKQTKIIHDPIFIIGHWRSGTTYIHSFLSQDKSLGFFSTFQAYLPGVFLGSEKLFKSIVESSLPNKRPMDDVEMNADLPQEDQYAVGAFTPYSYYHGWCFPKNMEFYNNFVLFKNVKKEDISKWKKTYIYLIKKVTVFEKGKRLVLKNQDNTTKIKYLLEMFPNAKFILMKRNPYTLYLSMMKFMRIVIPLYCLQNPPTLNVVEKSMMDLYKNMFKKYIREKQLIPKNNLIEIRYEDFILKPLEQIEKIYKQFDLEGFSENKESFKKYLAKQSQLKLDKYKITKEITEKVNKNWDFIFDEFGYKKLKT